MFDVMAIIVSVYLQVSSSIDGQFQIVMEALQPGSQPICAIVEIRDSILTLRYMSNMYLLNTAGRHTCSLSVRYATSTEVSYLLTQLC
jgi:hypothetical protein